MIRRMWCDDFDMNLPTVIPGALQALGDLADVELFTHCNCGKDGVLNHPCLWNSDTTMLAFFGFRNPSKPAPYFTTAPIVSCTAWEAFRDAWPHSFAMMIEGELIWDTFPLRGQFHELMQHHRGYRYSKDPKAIERRVLSTIAAAAQRLRLLTEQHAPVTRLGVKA